MLNIKGPAARGKAHGARRVASHNGNGACAPTDILGRGHHWSHSIHIPNEIRAAILRRETCALGTVRREHEEVEKQDS